MEEKKIIEPEMFEEGDFEEINEVEIKEPLWTRVKNGVNGARKDAATFVGKHKKKIILGGGAAILVGALGAYKLTHRSSHVTEGFDEDELEIIDEDEFLAELEEKIEIEAIEAIEE